ncbi:MAG: PAS domain-containing sensor histidine kinase [Gemmatimonadota bacterium]|nr:PAS domain-containing sensor histidine kinase [Gemmatimonadota bacterium]
MSEPSALPASDTLVAAHRDAVRRYGPLFAGIFSISVDAIVSCDESQHIILFNPGAEQIFGYAADEVIGQPLDMLIPEHSRAGHQAHVRAFGHSDIAARRMGERGEIAGRRKSGEVFPAEASISRLMHDGGMIYTAVLRDVSERKRAEQERSRLLEVAQHATRAREELLGVVSHDLRNPLSAIAMCVSALAESLPETDSGVGYMIDTIARSAELMNRLIQDLLDSAAIESGRVSMELTSQSPDRLIQEALTLLAPIAAERDILLIADVQPVLPLVRADRERVLQVLSNLVSNAVKFTPPGGRITLRAEQDAGMVRFGVADTGSGIPSEDVPHLFDRFWHARRAAHERGTGLGLFIVKGLVEAHGGRVRMESTPGQGSTFSFTLPILGGSSAP